MSCQLVLDVSLRTVFVNVIQTKTINTLREYDIIYRKLNCKYKLKTWFT